MQLSVIIVNYNVKFFLEQCLCSVTKAVKNIDAEIFVVDNNSADDSKTYFKERFTTLKFIWNKKNVGFARANNAALSFATGEYILFLNPDTIVPEDCFIKCLSFFEAHPEAGALGIHMIDGSGKFLKESKRSFPSPVISLYKLSGLTALFPKSKRFARYHLGHLDENKNNEVDVLAGAFIMVPKKILDTVGGFDEDFFMYGEDIDLSYKIQKAGYKNFYFAESTIIHFKGESTKKASLNYVRMFYKAMSIFVKKHYGGSKAGLFNLLIQCAITIRAFASATGRFIKWIGMPVIDAITILFSFWLIKILWNTYIKLEVRYSANLLVSAFVVFTLIYLLASYFSGLYDSGYKQSKLNRSALAALIVLLAGYSLLPESLRFSRGILVFGSVTAYVFITLLRNLLVHLKILERFDEDENKQTVIAGTLSEFNAALTLLQAANIKQRVLGRVEVENTNAPGAVANIASLTSLFTIYPVKEVIFCEGKLSFKNIIELVKTIPKKVRIKFFASGSESIIGSDYPNIAGKYFTHNLKYKLGTDVGKRNKQLADIIISLTFIVSFPLQLVFQNKPGAFFKNLADVLSRNKTWVGYASSSRDLPILKTSIITVTSFPVLMNTLPEENLVLADIWYAKNYTLWHDIQLVWKGYKFLGL